MDFYSISTVFIFLILSSIFLFFFLVPLRLKFGKVGEWVDLIALFPALAGVFVLLSDFQSLRQLNLNLERLNDRFDLSNEISRSEGFISRYFSYAASRISMVNPQCERLKITQGDPFVLLPDMSVGTFSKFNFSAPDIELTVEICDELSALARTAELVSASPQLVFRLRDGNFTNSGNPTLQLDVATSSISVLDRYVELVGGGFPSIEDEKILDSSESSVENAGTPSDYDDVSILEVTDRYFDQQSRYEIVSELEEISPPALMWVYLFIASMSLEVAKISSLWWVSRTRKF